MQKVASEHDTATIRVRSTETGSVQLVPSKVSAEPDSSTAAQNPSIVHEMPFNPPCWLSIFAGADQSVPSKVSARSSYEIAAQNVSAEHPTPNRYSSPTFCTGD